MTLEIVRLPVLQDNYVWLVRESAGGAVAVVDPAVADAPLEAAKARGWKITHILNTHHHGDHVGGNLTIQQATGCTIVGPRADRDRIPGIEIEVGDGDFYMFGKAKAQIFDVPGHTRGHIAYWFADDDALFCGDTLFALGCGRVFEGTMEQMWSSLAKLRRLPDTTRVYCAHEYTQSNARFAVTVEPDNAALTARATKINEMRARGEPTVPSTLGEEKATNPFLRPDSPLLQKTLGLPANDLAAVFGETRRRKDKF